MNPEQLPNPEAEHDPPDALQEVITEQESDARDAENLDEAPSTAPTISPWSRKLLTWVVILIVVGLAFVLGRLVGKDAPNAHQPNHEHSAENGTAWTCSMHPQIQSPEKGKCPICGMDLIPLGKGSTSDLSPNQIALTDRAKALARIQTTMVKPQASRAQELRLLGRLDYDETRTRTVTPWTEGRIDRLHVATTGQKVRQGQTVATLYSPEIYAAQQDLIQASKQLERLNSATPLAQTAAQATLEAARNRLRLLGITRGELKRMENAKAPWQKIPIRTPFAGTVIERLVDEGQYVSAGTALYRLVELSKLWVQLDAYEQDLPYLNEESSVGLTFEALPGEHFQGKIAFIDPVVDARKRTTRVRVEVSNAEGRLRPGMFAEAVVSVRKKPDAQPRLLIPDSAPLFSGKRSLVYVEVKNGKETVYEAREVRLGTKMGDVYPVIAGLEYGERVVTHGAFRLDADLQLRGGNSMMMRSDDRAPGAFDAITDITPSSQAMLAPIIGAYLDAQESFTQNDLASAKRFIVQLIVTSESLEKLEPISAQNAWEVIRDELLIHARVLSRTMNLDKARVAFEAMTKQLGALLRNFGNPTEQPVHLAFCPMAFDNRGAAWFQRGKEVQNTYFGPSMLMCGEVQDTVDAGSYLSASTSTMSPSSLPASSPASSPASMQDREH